MDFPSKNLDSFSPLAKVGIWDFLVPSPTCHTSVTQPCPTSSVITYPHSLLAPLWLSHFLNLGCLSIRLSRHRASPDSLYYLGITAHLRLFSHRLGSLFRSKTLQGFAQTPATICCQSDDSASITTVWYPLITFLYVPSSHLPSSHAFSTA